jgi:hypothetical protein
VSASKVASLIVVIRGDKALKDADVAALFGISRATLYDRIAGKLWRFKPRTFHRLSKAYDRGRLDKRPALAFTQAGVMLIAGILGDDESLEIGMDIAQALRTRRRSSANKKRPVQRANDPEKTSRYDKARSRLLTARLQALTGKTRH